MSEENPLKRKAENPLKRKAENPLKRKDDAEPIVSTATMQNTSDNATGAAVGGAPVGANTVDLSSRRAIRKYLQWNCKPITFLQLPKGNAVPRPVALDGASGVGKTQQAFALLKHGYKVAYVLMLRTTDSSQKIYQEMQGWQDENEIGLLEGKDDFEPEGYGLLARVDKAIEALKQKAKGEKDPLSEGFIDSSPSQVQDLVLRLFRLTMTYNTDDEMLVAEHQDARETKLSELEGTILFLDEALPKGYNQQSTDRLRFLRNMGCALKMQVVAAGTASTVANMIKQTEGRDESSRDEIDKTSLWIQCQLHWENMKEQDLDRLLEEEESAFAKTLINGNGVLKALLLAGRPLLVQHFVASVGELSSCLEAAGNTIMDSKKPSKQAKLTWLMGTWLEQKNLSSCPFAIKPPELVCNHFFEPALQIHTTGEPCVIKGILRTKNKAGPLSVSIHKIAPNLMEKQGYHFTKGAWALSYEGAPYVLTSSFADASRALSPCVQQCLAREPLLAIALSYAHGYISRLQDGTEFQDGQQFQDDLSACLEESPAEHTLSAMSGEQMECVVLAAIQLASYDNNGGPSVLEFCDNLVGFLQSRTSRGEILPLVCERWGLPLQGATFQKIPKKQTKKKNRTESADPRKQFLEASKKVAKESETAAQKIHQAALDKLQKLKKKKASLETQMKTGDPKGLFQKSLDEAIVQERNLEEYLKAGPPIVAGVNDEDLEAAGPVPRMVLASSHQEPDWVTDNKEDNPEDLKALEELGVAGLVPGEVNARCDIDAYDWPFKANARPCWSFEVKARSTSYSMQKGVDDLVAKCQDDRQDGGQYHAMLVAVRNQNATEVYVWKIQKDGKDFLRVLVLVAG